MAVNPSRFHLHNVADTCAVWNVLSSLLLYTTARVAGCSFCCTSFVHYECLHKPRKRKTAEDEELKERLRREMSSGGFARYSLEVDDLQDVFLLEQRRALSKGELSSIAFAKKIAQAFLTDDQRARTLAESYIDAKMVQTTPHLFGWLYFTSRLADHDKEAIIAEHQRLKRPLATYLEEMYRTALEYRLTRVSASDTAPGQARG